MSLVSQVEERRHRAVRRLAAAAAGALAAGVLLAVAAFALLGGRADETEVPKQAVPSTAPSHRDPQPTPVGTWTAPPVSAGPLLVPRPDRTVRGVPVGYPHTTEGAIGAAARYTETAVGLDAERAAAVGEVAGAPSYRDAARDLTQGVVAARSSLGLAQTGPTRGAYLTYQAKAYLVTEATPDRVVVSILGIADGAGPATGGMGRAAPSVASHTLVWVDGDWRLAGEGSPTPEPLPQPGSAQSYEEGWRDLAIA